MLCCNFCDATSIARQAEAEEAERKRKADEAERKRKADEEAELKRKAEEEAERKRKVRLSWTVVSRVAPRLMLSLAVPCSKAC